MRLTVDRMATGGDAVARQSDGPVVFVRGALPGEQVEVEIVERRRRFLRGRVLSVREAASERRDVTCPYRVDHSCGGCDWQHITPAAQVGFKTTLVAEQLQRLGGIEAPVVESAASVDAARLGSSARSRRTTVRCAVEDGRAGFRRRGSDAVQTIDQCGAAHPAIEELMADGRFGDADQVTLRVGIGTGDRMAVVHGGSAEAVKLPKGVVVASSDDPGDAAINTLVQGRPWRVSANSFFQTGDRGTEELVEAVSALASSQVSVVDLYAGVGLLGGSLGEDRLVAAVESSASSVADARHNLSSSVAVEHAKVEHLRRRSGRPIEGETVIADPARRGLGASGVSAIDAIRPSELVLVSCDPASLGRDAGLLRAAGWTHDRTLVVDMFPDTSRIEAVTRFFR